MKNELESICHFNCGAFSSKAGTRAGNGWYHFCSALMVCPPSDETRVIDWRHAPGMCKHFVRHISLNTHILTMGDIYEKLLKCLNISQAKTQYKFPIEMQKYVDKQ